MITRRDALRLAAVAAGTAAGPFAVSPVEAAALLDGPAGFDPGGARPSAWAANLLDPVQFASALDGIDIHDWFEHGAAVEMAEYKRVYNALLNALPALRDAPFDHPVYKLDEAAMGVWVGSWMAGVRAGAAYEHLRQAMVTPRMGCPRCHGNGTLWGGTPWRHNDDGMNREGCPDCGGAGTVSTPAPSAEAFAAG